MDINKLKEITAKYIEEIPVRLDNISREFMAQSEIRFLWYTHRNVCLKHLFIDKDLKGFKQNAFVCGRLDEYIIKKFNERMFGYAIDHFCMMLLSDDSNLINRYANLTYSLYEKEVEMGNAAPIYTMQAIIRDDKKATEYGLERMLPKTIKSFKTMRYDYEVLERIVAKDKQGVEEKLVQLAAPKISGRRDTGVQKLIYVHALCYAKLAWYKGLEVEIDSPFVPKELLPVEPLECYEDPYDFLKEIS